LVGLDRGKGIVLNRENIIKFGWIFDFIRTSFAVANRS